MHTQTYWMLLYIPTTSHYIDGASRGDVTQYMGARDVLLQQLLLVCHDEYYNTSTSHTGVFQRVCNYTTTDQQELLMLEKIFEHS